MARQRTTVAADADDLAVLREEANRRGVPLTVVLGEAVGQAADRLRKARPPRFGVGRSSVGAARASAAHPDEPITAADFRT